MFGVFGIERCVCALMYECLGEDTFLDILESLSCVNEEVVISTTKGLDTFVNPYCFDINTKSVRELADNGEITFGFCEGVSLCEFGVDLDFDGQAIRERGEEEDGVEVLESCDSSIVHSTCPCAFWCERDKSGGICVLDDVFFDKDRPREGGFCRWYAFGDRDIISDVLCAGSTLYLLFRGGDFYRFGDGCIWVGVCWRGELLCVFVMCFSGVCIGGWGKLG